MEICSASVWQFTTLCDFSQYHYKGLERQGLTAYSLFGGEKYERVFCNGLKFSKSNS